MEIKKYQSLTSTNTLAKNSSYKPWTVIWAEEQGSGYGRKKDAWLSPRGGLYFSIILPRIDIEDLQILNMLAAFSVAKAIKENFSIEPFIKLPNDIYLNQKKIAGILTETVVGKTIKFCVMGIGVNTNINKFPPELENTATSLKIELGKDIDNEKILKQIVLGVKKLLKTVSK
jgi:BirA family biotin operon repressor/biotin-[acetyl-CoA-carboxylase] ligase